jgi:phosphate transport system substrate-binding protein
MIMPHKAGANFIAISDAASVFLAGWRAEVASVEYPLTRFIQIFVDRRPGEPIASLEYAFLPASSSAMPSPDGQRAVEQDGIFMALPAHVAAEQRAKLE